MRSTVASPPQAVDQDAETAIAVSTLLEMNDPGYQGCYVEGRIFLDTTGLRDVTQLPSLVKLRIRTGIGLRGDVEAERDIIAPADSTGGTSTFQSAGFTIAYLTDTAIEAHQYTLTAELSGGSEAALLVSGVLSIEPASGADRV